MGARWVAKREGVGDWCAEDWEAQQVDQEATGDSTEQQAVRWTPHPSEFASEQTGEGPACRFPGSLAGGRGVRASAGGQGSEKGPLPLPWVGPPPPLGALLPVLPLLPGKVKCHQPTCPFLRPLEARGLEAETPTRSQPSGQWSRPMPQGGTCPSPNLPVLARETPVPMCLGPEVPDRCEALETARLHSCWLRLHPRCLVTHCPPCPQSPTWRQGQRAAVLRGGVRPWP